MYLFKKTIYILLSLFLIIGCEDDKRLPIKVIETKNGYYEWYYYSLITSDSPDYIDFVDGNCVRTLIYKGHDVVDVRLEKTKLRIECNQCDTLELNPSYENQIRIVESDNFTYLEKVNATHYKDSLKRSVKIKRCN